MADTQLITAQDIARELQGMPNEPEELQVSLQSNPYIGVAAAPFAPEAVEVLLQTIPDADVEIRPDGLIYLPEIKYRRILNRAFGPGAWSMIPMDITVAQSDNMLYYRGALFVHGRFVSEAIGEQQYFASNDRMSYATAAESAKSNCLMRCCKDLGIASELWDPTFVREWISKYAQEVWCSNIGSGGGDRGKKRKMWRKKSAPPIDVYPWREEGAEGGTGAPGAKQQTGFQLPAGKTEPAADPKPGRFQDMKEQRGAMGKAHNPQASAGPVITFRQVKRFQAIAGDRGWTPEEVQRLLARSGYESPDNISRTDYDKLCQALENPEALAEIRTVAPEPVAAPQTDLSKFGELTPGSTVKPAAEPEEENTRYEGGCTKKQLKRMRGIAGKHNPPCTDDEIKRIMRSHGFESFKLLTPAAYEKVCADLENPIIIREMRDTSPYPSEPAAHT